MAHISYSERLYVSKGDPRSSLSFLTCQKKLSGQGKSLKKKRGWNHDRWQAIAQTDNVFDLCQLKRAVFGLQVKIIYYYDKYFYCKTALSSSFSYQLFRLCLRFFFPQKAIICWCFHPAEIRSCCIQSCCIQCVFSCLF